MRQQAERETPNPPHRTWAVTTSDYLRWAPSTTAFIFLTAALNTALYHLPLFSFAVSNLDVATFSGILTLVTLLIGVFLETALLLILPALVSHRILKPFCMVMAVGNAVALYFLVTYHVVLDATMMGNVLNTDFAEASAYLHPTLIVYVLVLGVLPCWLLTRVRIRRSPRLRLVIMASVGLVITVTWTYLSAATWLWIDDNSKRLGGMILPWSYVINAARYEAPRIQVSGPPASLPPATFSSSEKTVVILVIGEASRAQNFALYGYDRPTNPLLSTAGVVALKNATSCATYTTESIRCILSHVDTESPFSKQYELLPSYLQRNGVDVIWRTRNFGEPPIRVGTYQKASDLSAGCAGAHCDYDEVLLSGLEQRIETSSSQRVLVVIHQSGSHGPDYYKRYPNEFEHFRPVCKSVELSQCTPQELVNTYDNTILHEDHFLFQVIGTLKSLQHTSALMIYISDHGESLGEYGLYLHGVPYSVAPDVQKDIPFVVWMSDEFRHQKAVQTGSLESQGRHSQRDVFHSVMGAFSMHSDAYVAEYDIFSKSFASQ